MEVVILWFDLFRCPNTSAVDLMRDVVLRDWLLSFKLSVLIRTLSIFKISKTLVSNDMEEERKSSCSILTHFNTFYFL